MSTAKATVKQVLNDAKIKDTRRGEDTIRIWESYRDQALLWRALTLIQAPVTLGALFLVFLLWQGRSITLNVPARPKPGQYAVTQLPDLEFIETAGDFVNLIATYQPFVAERQFKKAAEMTTEPLLERFRQEMLKSELEAIATTSRTQIFFADPTKTRVTRDDEFAHVSFTGSRLKIVAGRELPLVTTEFAVTMTTVPRNELNPYGIVITNVSSKNVEES
jgi:hypothetical protein